METSAIINIIGLLFDIIGVILLFFYEPPKPEIDAILLESAPSLEDREKVRDIKKKISYLALLLIITGFIIQMISTFFIIPRIDRIDHYHCNYYPKILTLKLDSIYQIDENHTLNSQVDKLTSEIKCYKDSLCDYRLLLKK